LSCMLNVLEVERRRKKAELQDSGEHASRRVLH
jgi:hypothetical protein